MPSAWRNSASTDRSDARGSLGGVASSGKNFFKLTAEQCHRHLEPAKRGESSCSTVTMVSPSQTRRPSTAALARPRIRSASRSACDGDPGCRARSRQSARRIMPKLASATAICEQARRQCRFGNGDHRIRNDRNGSHRGEVMAANREGEEPSAPVSSISTDLSRRPTARASAPIRAPRMIEATTKLRIPEYPYLRPRRQPCRYNAWWQCRRRQSPPQAKRRPERALPEATARPKPVRTIAAISERNVREDVVAARNSRRERQHRYEMSGPNSKTAGRRGNCQPQLSHASCRPAGMVENTDGGKRSQHTDDSRQNDKTQVMCICNAVVNGKHVQPAFVRIAAKDWEAMGAG